MGNLDERAETIRIGNLAKDVIENEAFQSAMNHSMNDLFMRFLASNPEDDELRTKIWAVGQSLDAMKNRLTFMVESGRMEQDNKSYDDN